MELNEQGELPKIYIDKLPQLIGQQALVYRTREQYAKGRNPVILHKPKKQEPDNRVPTPIARKAVKTVQGYATKPGNISYSSDGDYANEIKELVLDLNDEELLTSELWGDCLTAGFGFEVLRMDASLNIRQYRIKPDSGFMVYDDTLDNLPIAFVHLATTERLEGERLVEAQIMTIYYADQVVEYTRQGQSAFVETDRFAHPFGAVPAVRYRISPELENLFDAVLYLIDEHDKIISSDYADEHERFANAYLLIAKELASADFDDIKAKRIFQRLKEMGETGSVTDSVAFLTKPSRGAETAEAADRFERLIYEQLMVINPADKQFATVSGIALAYKILPMEWLVSSFMAYFQKGLQQRFELIGTAWSALGRGQPEWITIHARRNLPIDMASIAQVAGMLKGILSDETILNLFPADIVPNVQLELDRLSLISALPALEDDNDSPDAD
jgi:SPP1 family phage portal protein